MAGIGLRLGGMLASCAGLAALERSLLKRLAVDFPILTQTTALAVPRLYGFVLLNAVASGFMMFFLGMKVGLSRKTFIEKAKEAGDEEAEERFSYPKVYAEGFSESAKHFNCVQRGHQQALETYPQVLAFSLIGGLAHPVLTSLGQVVWMIARWKWAQGYASGDPLKRYSSSKWSFHIWTSLILQMVLAGSTAVQVLSQS
uniref:Glutathione transferase n=1 Tax=Noctiluca scintillans TaxID=2966 RepID=A0A7S1FAW8_NOCSC|mmetsp:Transcript_48737/g.129203  ORF Transcript_48737/g.129203 Transcript_48737/m.129203 type:complete len:200 (+) Transcript_48737:43-642(+)